MLTAPATARPYGTVLGMTESCGPHLTQPHPTYGMDLPDHLRGSLGIPAPHFDHKIVDPEDGETIVEGDGEGELCIRGYATLAALYKLERHQVFDDDGYYHTGDRVRVEEGLYFFTGRVTEMIKAHGANVAPPEVEGVLESFPEVKFAFVVGIPDAERGEQVAAVVVPTGDGPVDLSVLRDKARTELSSFKVPRVFLCMTEDEVPWLATGKPDKRAMKSLLVEAAANS
jgi:acyl-CoA synthetase (AMP-forming)/AMP-acid ligase II